MAGNEQKENPENKPLAYIAQKAMRKREHELPVTCGGTEV